MSPPRAPGSYAIIHHFYPIDPDTSIQQSSMVYNSPSAPLVAPIDLSTPPPKRGPKPSIWVPKRSRDDDLSSEEEFTVHPPVKRRKRARTGDSQLRENQNSVTSIPQSSEKGRRIAYVDVPLPIPFDRSSYKPLSESSYAPDFLTLSRRNRATRPRISNGPRATSVISDHSDGSDSYVPSEAAKGKGKWKMIQEDEHDEGSTCHQCRRKTISIKMRCRNVREDESVCPLLLCQSCMEVRYGEDFKPDHLSWHCPRCRGICNCSICLRKAGLGYILDSEGGQPSGHRGRLNKPKRKSTALPVSVREWLARQGVLGTDEWMEEGRQRGVRYFVGTTPPPPDGPSPYEPASLNAYLAAHAHAHKELNDDENPPPVARPMVEDGVVPHVEKPAIIGDNNGPDPGSHAIENGLESGTPVLPDHRTSTPLGNESVPQGSGHAFNDVVEDHSKFTTPQKRNVRLIVGRSLSRPVVEKKVASRPRAVAEKWVTLRPRAVVEKKVASPPRSEPEMQKVLPSLPIVKKRGRPKKNKVEAEDDMVHASTHVFSLPSVQSPEPSSIPVPVDEEIEEEDEQAEADMLSKISKRTNVFMVDGYTHPATPPPPPPSEPVLVPTEHYTSSKLDLAHPKDIDSPYGPSFWALGAESRYESRMLFSYTALPSEDVVSGLHSSPPTSQASGFPPAQQAASDPASRMSSGYQEPKYPVAVAASSYAAVDDSWMTTTGATSGSMFSVDIPMEPLVE